MAAKKAPTTAVARAKVQLPAEVEAQMNADIAAFQQRMSAPAGNRIAVTQDKKFRDANGDKHDTIQGVIVDFVAKKGYYVNEYDKEEVVPPNCFAIGFVQHSSLEPSENSPDQQHDSCATCPKNAFKSAKNGKGKACKDSYIIALLPPDADETTPLTTLSISATGLKPFEKYVRDLARDFGKAPYCFVTEFSFDKALDYASVRAGNPEPADGMLIALAYSKREEAKKLLEAEPDTSEFDEKVRKQVGPSRWHCDDPFWLATKDAHDESDQLRKQQAVDRIVDACLGVAKDAGLDPMKGIAGPSKTDLPLLAAA